MLGRRRAQGGLFNGREVVSLVTGEPVNLEPLMEDTPSGWIVTGYPWHCVKTPEHEQFLKAYQARFKDHPRVASVMAYATIHSIAEGIRRAAPPSC